MKRIFIATALIAALFAATAHAQRSQALCSRDTDGVVDGSSCVEMTFRMFSGDSLNGIEEDAIIGVGSADVTLSHAQLSDLETTRVVLVSAPGTGKYFFIDWVAVIKTAADGAPLGTGGGRVGLGVSVAPQAGGVLDVRPTIYAQAVGVRGPGVLSDGATIGRFSPTAIGVAEATAENTPIVVAVLGPVADWNAVVAELDATVTLRIIVRYRVIDTADTF